MNGVFLLFSGTMWMVEILDMIHNDGDVVKCRRATSILRVPFLESKFINMEGAGSGLDFATTSPRVLVTHLRAHLLPRSIWEQNCKVMEPM
ncbi:PREDICTED: sulfotransferase 1C3-like [Chinchilla lanigera]|uniref:sulfotransferase 1C3-like n=1 Tax=Chinchilla lanigera TaxID=34839 RepID=UPI0006992258|nr:PREDICTED: sulfotransferase 1C3-like [Chinchilla lanigera]